MPRNPATTHLLETLIPNPNLPPYMLQVSEAVWKLAADMCVVLNDGPELTAGLRKLREAKDCFVIQRKIDADNDAPRPGLDGAAQKVAAADGCNVGGTP